MKRRLIKFGLALTAVMLAVGLAGCPTDSPAPAPVSTIQTQAIVTTVTINGITASVGQGNATLATVTGAYQNGGKIGLPKAPLASVTLAVGRPNTSNRSTIEYALIASGGTPTFAATIAATDFADGKILIIKSTAEDGVATMYFRVDIEMGRNANLASLIIGVTPQTTEEYLGVPAATVAAITTAGTGTFQTDRKVKSATAFTLKATPEDTEDATIQ